MLSVPPCRGGSGPGAGSVAMLEEGPRVPAAWLWHRAVSL